MAISEKYQGALVCGRFSSVCRGPEGNIKWIEDAPNIVTTQGLNHLLRVLTYDTLDGAAFSNRSFEKVYCIIDTNNAQSQGAPTGATFTYANEGSSGLNGTWVEGQAYSTQTGSIGIERRPFWQHDAFGSGTAVTVSNGTAADFFITGTMTVYGAGLVFQPGDTLIGSHLIGTQGDIAAVGAVLYNISAFTSSKNVSDGDQLSVTVTLTASSS